MFSSSSSVYIFIQRVFSCDDECRRDQTERDGLNNVRTMVAEPLGEEGNDDYGECGKLLDAFGSIS